ncbi:hypothetical protein EC991_005710 [Linnemannia zychae]|nr:hypothetical protein EC991_005710 [Linnemannia zychae]
MSSMIGHDSRASSPSSDSEIDTNINNDDADHQRDDIPNQSTSAVSITPAQPFVGDHHSREQDQSYIHAAAAEEEHILQEAVVSEDDEYVSEGEDGWGDGENDDDEHDELEPDPVYVADVLRKSGIDWMQHPKYATHRLVVTSTTSEEQENERQYYLIMDHFLIPESAVFRDFLQGVAPPTSDNEDSNDDDEGREEFQRVRLACLQDGPLDSSLENNTTFLNTPSYAPDLEYSVLQPLMPYINRSHASHESSTPNQLTTPATMRDALSQKPWIHLSLPYPQRFPGLLQAIYTMDLTTWEETYFRPETIAEITATVSRLECSSTLTLCCLEYYRKIKAIISVEEFEQMYQDESGMEELTRLYRAAVEGGMLPPDPDL